MPRRPGSDALRRPSGRAEARWFLRGAMPNHLRPAGEFRVRVDLYHEPTLTPTAAWKRRGARTAEFKYRDPLLCMVRVHRLGGIAEQWHKVRPSEDPTLSDRWLAVEKRLWERTGLQVAEIRLEGVTWSTIAVRLDAVRSREAATTIDRWREPLEDLGMAMSYPTWLLARRWLDCGDPAQVLSA